MGYHYGAQNYSELKNMLRKSIVLMGSGGIINEKIFLHIMIFISFCKKKDKGYKKSEYFCNSNCPPDSIEMMILARILAFPLAKIFVGYDVELFEMTTHAFKIFAFAFILAGMNIFTSSFFTALNNGGVSAIIFQ